MYVLYSTQAHGYLSQTSAYTSIFANARRFNRDEAIDLARLHKAQAGYNIIPVRVEDVEALNDER